MNKYNLVNYLMAAYSILDEAELAEILNCKQSDLEALARSNYDPYIFKGVEEIGLAHDLNWLLEIIIKDGFDEIKTSIYHDFRNFLDYEDCYDYSWNTPEDKEKGLDEIASLDVEKDFEYKIDGINTHIYCINNYETYKRYFQDYLNDFQYLTGFSISPKGQN